MKRFLAALSAFLSTRVATVLPLVVMLGGAALLVLEPLPIKRLRNDFFDQYQRWMPRTYQEVPVRVVDIDEESLRRVGQWPWARTQVARMVDNMRAVGATVIGFDVVLSEPDRTSPRAVAKVWSQVGQASPDLLSQIETLPDQDQLLAQSLAKGRVVLGLTLQHEAPRAEMSIPLVKPAPYVTQGPPVNMHLYAFEGVAPSLLPLQQAVAGNGAMTFVPDDDGVVRRVPLVMRYRDTLVPSLIAEMLRVAQGAQSSVLVAASSVGSDSAGVQALRIGRYTIPTTAQAESWVYFTRPQPSRSIPAWRVLQGEIAPGSLNGVMVLVGSSAQGLMDMRVSPLGVIIPGVEVHAQMLEQALLNQPLIRPTWAIAAELLLVLVIGTAVGMLALRARSLLAASLTGLTIAIIMAAGISAFVFGRMLFNPMTPSLIIVACWITGSLMHHVRSERQQRWLTEAFSRYVSPNKVDFLVKHPEGLELGGTRRTCSFIFTDLQGFTTLMEGMDPALAVSALNVYLDGMVAITFKHEGTLDRIMGDAVAVVFSAPVPQEDHRQRAFDCAMEMAQFARQYAANLKAKGVPFGNTRIGVHCGDVIVGNFGGSHLFDYRALGDPVNTAARLESVNKHLGTLFCVSEAIIQGCINLPDIRPVGRLVLKGKSKPLMVYQPLLADDVAQQARRADYEVAYGLVAATGTAAQGLDASHETDLEKARYLAEQALAELNGLYPHDPLVKLHLRRMRAGETGDVMVMSEK